MFRFFGKLLGFVEDEYHHIVSDFQSAISRLEALAQRKRDLVVDKTNEIDLANVIRADAQEAAAKAQTTANKLAALIG